VAKPKVLEALAEAGRPLSVADLVVLVPDVPKGTIHFVLHQLDKAGQAVSRRADGRGNAPLIWSLTGPPVNSPG
jgi:hypothetical protein